MQVNFCCTHWGCESKSPVDFLKAVVREGFSGAEINLASGVFTDIRFRRKLDALRGEKPFVFIAQQVLEQRVETPDAYTRRMLDRFYYLADFEPDFINSHTGKDYYSFDENCRIIEIAEDFSAKTGIPLCHETHRGRFSFHLPALVPYLEKFPQLKLTADLSHFCCVSETLLEEQEDLVNAMVPHVRHIHARVGWQQSAQVNDPFAPEWEAHLSAFVKWWKKIIAHHSKNGQPITVTPEAGPFPYMPQLPHSKQDVANQWQINAQMKNYLTQQLHESI